MRTRERIAFIVALGAIACTAGVLIRLRTHQRLGQPGIKAAAIERSIVMSIDLPEHVLDFSSTNLPQAQLVLDYLPKDTSFARRFYTSPEGLGIDANIILMGTDRTSIHTPDICLPGQGVRVEQKSEVEIPIAATRPYSLRVAKWSLSNVTVATKDGQPRKVHGLYVFWFVSGNATTPRYFHYRCRLMWDLLRTGILERWAYVSYFAFCEAGQEDATFEKMKQLIAASVPQFQLLPGSVSTGTVAER